MANPKIGLQLSTVAATVREVGVYETMKKIAEIGIHHVEISQVLMNEENINLLLKAKEDFGIQVSAISAMLEPMNNQWDALFDNLEQNFDKIVADCKALGCTAVRIGSTSPAACGSYEAALEYAKKTNAVGQKLKEQGIDLYFHTHHFELAMHNGQTVLEILRDNGENYGFELDIHWLQRGGFNPVKVIESFDGRVRLLHLKDYRIGHMQVEPDVDFNSREGMMKAYASMNNIVEFAEVGEGTLDIPACIEAGLAGGSEYFLVEQDMTYGRDPFDCLKTSRDNLVKMGYGDWF